MATIQEQLDSLSAMLGTEAEFLNTTKADKTAVATAVANLQASIAAQATAQAAALSDGLAGLLNQITNGAGSAFDTFKEIQDWIAANVSAIQAISDRVKLTVQSLSASEKAQVQANLDVPSNARVDAVEAAATLAASNAVAAAAAATSAVDAKLGYNPAKDYRQTVRANYPSRYPV